jgi:hypothetical protein
MFGRNPDQLPVDGPWLVAKGEHNGRICIIRCNSGYKDYGSLAGYEHQVGIAVPFRAAQPSGLPSPQEELELNPVEDAICASLEETAQSLLVAIITTSGMREFVLYTCAPEQVKQRFVLLRGSITSHQLQLMIQPDKDWAVYAQLC